MKVISTIICLLYFKEISSRSRIKHQIWTPLDFYKYIPGKFKFSIYSEKAQRYSLSFS